MKQQMVALLERRDEPTDANDYRHSASISFSFFFSA